MSGPATRPNIDSSPLRVCLVGPVAQSIPPTRSGSIETVTAMLADGLVTRGHDVTLFATGDSATRARVHAVFPQGYHEDTSLWPWELCELFNLAAAVERAREFDVIHYQAEYSPISLGYARVCPTPLLQTVHHAPTSSEVAVWARYPDAPFIAVSQSQAQRLAGLNIVDTIQHAVDPKTFRFQSPPDDYLLFLGRFTEEKGVVDAIEVARSTGRRIILAAAENEYYRQVVAPLVDNRSVSYAGEVELPDKVALLQHATALLYPLRSAESFGLVLAEAMMCGTPVAALARGAVRDVVDNGVTGYVFPTLSALQSGLDKVLTLDRAKVRAQAEARFGPNRMVDAHVAVYARLGNSTHQVARTR